MNAWVVRGLGMALIHVFVRVILGVSIAQWPLQGSSLRWFALVTVVVAVLVWAWMDGVRDRRTNPDPADGADLTMLWLKAALLGGIVAGLGSWLADLVPPVNVTQNSFFFELTSGAAFTVLLIFVPAMLAVFLGRFFVGRESPKPLGKRNSTQPVPAGAAEAAAGGTADQVYAQSANTEYAGSDDETTVFDAVHSYREDTSDLDSPEGANNDYADHDYAEGDDAARQDPADPGERPTDGLPRKE
ncbi:B-4DMT family transporter [Rhodococcus marinonascens]|uniref:B-4DMT family transporter n=1 Tax=Rhodococcus marinonascens TaxID=38311 RepID=UPI000934C8F8|nr:B-4DMT family transporter [Rhodococcus marinonascens]